MSDLRFKGEGEREKEGKVVRDGEAGRGTVCANGSDICKEEKDIQCG